MIRLTELCLSQVISASALIAISVIALGQEQKIPAAPHRSFAPKINNPYPLPPGEPGSMVGGPWIIDANFKSAVYIKNDVETAPSQLLPFYISATGLLTNLRISH